jgi:hypothetical protein
MCGVWNVSFILNKLLIKYSEPHLIIPYPCIIVDWKLAIILRFLRVQDVPLATNRDDPK